MKCRTWTRKSKTGRYKEGARGLGLRVSLPQRTISLLETGAARDRGPRWAETGRNLWKPKCEL